MTKTINFNNECRLSEINIGDFLVYPSRVSEDNLNDTIDILELKDKFTTYDGRVLFNVIKKSEVVEIIESKSGKTLTINIKRAGDSVSTFYKGLKTSYIFNHFDK